MDLPQHQIGENEARTFETPEAYSLFSTEEMVSETHRIGQAIQNLREQAMGGAEVIYLPVGESAPNNAVGPNDFNTAHFDNNRRVA